MKPNPKNMNAKELIKVAVAVALAKVSVAVAFAFIASVSILTKRTESSLSLAARTHGVYPKILQLQLGAD